MSIKQNVLISLDVLLKQGTCSEPDKQYAVLFENINMKLTAESVELLTGIEPTSVENCERGLIVKLKSQEEHDKMLELSGEITLKRRKARILIN